MQPSAALADTSPATTGREESPSCLLLILQRAEQRQNNVLTQLTVKPLGKTTRTWATPSRRLSMQQKLPIGVIQRQKLHSRLG